MADTKKLDDSQLEHFNTELMQESYWKKFIANLKSVCDTTKPFTLLDIGGGNGVFADKLLDIFPTLTITVLDNAKYLLDMNRPSDRKKLVYGSATELDKVLKDERYDVITFNWVLHHLVTTERNATLEIIQNTLAEASNYLAPNGHISVIENLYPGLLMDSYPSRFIFGLTSIKNPLFAKVVRKAGFNTAGVGVCFMSPKIIRKRFEVAKLKVEIADQIDRWGYNIFIRFCLHTRPMRMINFWLTKQN